MKFLMVVHATGGKNSRSQNGVNGRAANGESLRRKKGEKMGEYYRRTGEAIIGATSKTRGKVAKVVQNPRGRS